MCAWSRGDVRRNWGHARGRSSRKRASERLREGTVGRGQGERGAACRRPVDHAVSKTSPKARGCPCAGPRLSASVSVLARPTARHARSCRSPMRARGAQSNMTGLSGSRHIAQKRKKRDLTQSLARNVTSPTSRRSGVRRPGVPTPPRMTTCHPCVGAYSHTQALFLSQVKMKFLV